MMADRPSSDQSLFNGSPLARRFHDAKLDSKLAISLVAIALVGFALMFAALTGVISRSFSELENASVMQNVQRTRAALDEYSSRVETAVRDYGAWDESYNYLLKPTHKFEEGTFSILAMTNLDVNGMAYARFDGSVPFSRWVDIERQVEMPGLAREFESEVVRLARDPRSRTIDAVRYYARFGDKVAAISAARVIRTDGSGTSSGIVVMARELNSQQLSDLLQVNARLALSDRKPAPLVSQTADLINIAVNIPGRDGQRVAQAKFSVERDLSALGKNTLLLSVISAAIILMLTALAMRMLMKHLVIAPMKEIERHMQRVSISGDLRALDVQLGHDELGSLASNLNSMLRQLKDLREQLEIQSFKLGRTESAVGVMHNVRNGLNPINVILARILTEPRVASAEDAVRAIEELADPTTEPTRRAKLSQFLQLALNALVSQSERRREEMRTARDCLSSVVDIIGKQQAAAHERIATEPCAIADIIRQNAALAQFSSAGRVRLVVADGDYAGLANRVLLSQVVGNLLSNSIESIAAMNRETGLIEVTFDAGPDWLNIHIRDNGEGFSPDKGKLLFERGYSSRKQKSGGLGLHWCANALALMDGRLTLESDGPGLGATATIKLPVNQVLENQMPQAEDKAGPDSATDNAPEVPAREIRSRR